MPSERKTTGSGTSPFVKLAMPRVGKAGKVGFGGWMSSFLLLRNGAVELGARSSLPKFWERLCTGR